MTLSQSILLILICITAPAVVLITDLPAQAVVLSFYGVLLGILFFIFKAPDVALSQIVIGAVVLPLMILLSLTKIRRNEEEMAQRKKSKKAQNGSGEYR